MFTRVAKNWHLFVAFLENSELVVDSWQQQRTKGVCCSVIHIIQIIDISSKYANCRVAYDDRVPKFSLSSKRVT